MALTGCENTNIIIGARELLMNAYPGMVAREPRFLADDVHLSVYPNKSGLETEF